MNYLNRNAVTHINALESGAAEELGAAVREFVEAEGGTYGGRDIVFLCIGSDRATGDCLGPITGHKLSAASAAGRYFTVYGTLENPIHAKNIGEAMDNIYNAHDDPFIIAVDACLGRMERIGFLTVGGGGLAPGAGLHKRLPDVGNVFVTGVVNCFSGIVDFAALQNTRLGLVMKMSDVICGGLLKAMENE
ncbi:MAG: spore protease YyaC [Defluviitaleaceae bacterium]|nr:spore protease YyaC [Defluviitaleaceae bacterium]